ncbi:MAG: hybrid sensor histidine kinase/response regulator [Deltaproteobacteria bacterium]|nr:hybrid sensor histidine kinase/response regulator [Deltaproteobacteria bacterium]
MNAVAEQALPLLAVPDPLPPIRARADEIMRYFVLGHFAFALCLAPVYGTWFVTGVVASAALLLFLVSAWLLPGQFVTRCMAGVSLQMFCALHIFQLHGLPEMHFFFFTSTTVLILYQDEKALWLGVGLIIAQHILFAVLQNSGVQVHFFPETRVGVFKLSFHFGIALVQAAIASGWAWRLKRQTLRQAQDEADRRVMDARLMLSEKLASLGMLAAGVGHEINNPLAVTMASVEYIAGELKQLRDELPQRLQAKFDELAEPIKDVEEATIRIRDVVRDLRMLSRSEKHLGAVDVTEVVAAAVRATHNEVRHRAQLVRALPRLPLVRGDPARLGQVFINLFINAAHAIPEGRSSENHITVEGKVDGLKVVVSVRDSGVGMSPAVVSRVFDPFFTTKQVGAGTGLGLSICHRIVTDLGGTIEVESVEGRGSTFRVVLPLASQGEQPSPAPYVQTGPQRQRGRVLVIDDEKAIGGSIARLLPEHDLTLLTGAKAALGLLAAGDRWDVIVCDLMMPEMSGLEFYAELRKRFPTQAQATVFLTGGAFTPHVSDFLAGLPREMWMEKPFEAEALKSWISARLRAAAVAA